MRHPIHRQIVACVVIVLALHCLTAAADDSPVQLKQDDASFTLSNPRLSARIDKRSGGFFITYNDFAAVERGYWSQVGRSSAGDIGRFGANRSAAVLDTPDRAEVAVTFAYDGKSAGLPCDVTFRYSLAKGDSALYAAAAWVHKSGYPAFSVGEARMAMKLNAAFDFLAVDKDRFRQMPSGADWDRGTPLNLKEARRMTTGPRKGEPEHKYDYSAILGDTPAYGWCSTTARVGVWLINPSIEYLAGGPTKVELTGHLDVNPGGAPTLLNMFHGSHYGGSSLAIAQNEEWSKLFGPMLIYCNAGDKPEVMWQDALARARAEQEAWPFGWFKDPLYPPADQRAKVTGQLRVKDVLDPNLNPHNIHVGLASPAYKPAQSGRGAPADVDWQRDSKHYQFWTLADDATGRFTIPNIRPGSYTLYAFADGVLGEFSKADVTVTAGQSLDVGELKWQPMRFGKTLWDIGTPDRSAAEFRHGDEYWKWGLYYEYTRDFPNNVNYVIGQSTPRKDWNYAQCARIDGKKIDPAPWTIAFNLDSVPKGKATLRLAICGSRGSGGIDAAVNNQPIGSTGTLPESGVIHRDGIRGYWFERDLPFDASLLKQGQNTLTVTTHPRSWVDGVLYDYVRLELAEN
jgi:rhamnogalacturonan endolyase